MAERAPVGNSRVMLSDYLTLRRPRRRARVKEAYAAWSSAHGRCACALRAWSAAAPSARAGAYDAYLMELEFEEAAAGELARLHAVQAA